MAVITTPEFLDGGIARTAGETMTLNGGSLTIRTDTRWHANAPAALTGCLGGNSVISSTLGGEFFVDATAVRWMPYTSGSGNVPAIGTTVTRGAVSAYLLGVWATVNGAPSAVGAAMPATGYLKFREVTGGPFTAGALTGIGATAASPDVTGWVEVVAQQLANFNIPRLGRFKTRGDWFYLANTTGSANQNVLIPNMGSTTGYSPGVWIQDGTGGAATYTWAAGVVTVAFPAHVFVVGNEVDLNFTTGGAQDTEHHTYRIRSVTADAFTVFLPGSGAGGDCNIESYDFYSALYAAGMTTTNFGTDVRSKVVLMNTDASITIGHNGTTAVGFVPAAARKIRIPNVLLRQCTTGARATNAIPHPTLATRPDFTTTNAGVIDMEFTFGDWFLSFSQPFGVYLRHVATHDSIAISECASPLELSDGGTGTSAGLSSANLTLTSCFSGGEIYSWIGAGFANALSQVNVNFCIGQTFSACRFGVWTYARSATRYAIAISQSSDITVADCGALNATNNINTSFNINFLRYDHCDRYVGATNATTGLFTFTISNSCVGVVIDGTSFGFKGAIANAHPYNGLVSCAASSNIKIRNLGARDAILDGGSANFSNCIYSDGGNNVDVKVQRCYMQPTRTGAHLLTNSSKNILLEDVYGDFTDLMNVAALNCLVRGGGGRNGVAGQASVYGTHFGGAFDSDTTGRMWLALNEPTAETLQFTSRLFSAGSGFTSAGGLSLATVDDFFICEMQESRLQTTGFANIAPTITGTNTGNHLFEYQLDTGSGYGAWQTLNAANLSAETILPSVGYKLKFRITCVTANNANLITYVRCDTTSTLAAQVGNLYPLDTGTVSISGLVAGSRVVAKRISDGLVVANQAEVGGTVLFSTDQIVPLSIEARKASAAPFYIPWQTQITPVADATVSAVALQQLDQ